MRAVSNVTQSSRLIPSRAARRPQPATLLQVLLAGAVAIALATTGCTRSRFDENDNTLNLVLKLNVKGLDPLFANDQYSSSVIGHIYEGLLGYHYLKRPYELVPQLAESMPEVSKDGLTYTFKIKKGVRFQDNAAFPNGKGREVTAEDFIYSWKRLADPRNVSDGFWIFQGKIVGLDEWAQGVKAETADYDTAIEGLKAADSHTLVIKLKTVYHQLPYVLAMPFASVVPKEAVDKYGKEFINNPVGTGPFMLAQASDWVRNSKITLQKNPNYRPSTYPTDGASGDKEAGLLADAGQTVPFVDRVVFNEVTEDQPRFQNLMKGNFDFGEIPKDNFESTVKDGKVAPELAAKGVYLEVTPAMEVVYVAFNMTDPVLGKNKKLRQAFSAAYDNASFIQKFYNGRALKAESPIPPGIDSYDPNYKNPVGTYDLEKAKKLLAEAGFEGGKGLPEFTYETLADATSRQGAEFYAQSLASIGIKMKIASNTWPQFQDKIKKQQAQIFGIAWGADYPDAQNFYQLFWSENKSPGPNDSSFSNSEFDKLYVQSLKLPPGEERTRLYHRMRDIVTEESPWIFNAHRLQYRAAHGWLTNFKWTEVAFDYAKYLRVDPKKRAEIGKTL